MKLPHELEARLAESERENKGWLKESQDLSIELVNTRDKLSVAEARVKELSEFIKDKGLR